MGVDLTGDWGKCMSVLDNLATKVKSETGKKIAQSVKKIEAKVLEHMDNQDLDWDDLNKDYAKTKEQKGLSPDTLRASNQMYSNITTHQADDFTGAVGVKRGAKNQDGEDITDVAIIHEQPDNDGKKIPARKLWEPTFEEMKNEIPPEIMGGVTRMLKKMIEACKQFLNEQIKELNGYENAFPFEDENIFFGPMPRDFLKDHQFAACCLVLHDKKKKDGSLVANVRDEKCEYYTRTRRQFERKIMFRILLYAASFGDKWGQADIPGLWDFEAFKGLVDQLELRIAAHKIIVDEYNTAVKIDLQDSFRPWDVDEATQALKKTPLKAIVRVEFTGGIYTQKKVPIIGDIDIQPEFK